MKKLLISGSLLNQNMNNVLTKQFGFFDNDKIYLMEIDEIGEYSAIPTELRRNEYSMSGEMLNDEFALQNHPLHPFDPQKRYRVREGINGREVIGFWNDYDKDYEVPGTELIGDKRSPEKRSFGH